MKLQNYETKYGLKDLLIELYRIEIICPSCGHHYGIDLLIELYRIEMGVGGIAVPERELLIELYRIEIDELPHEGGELELLIELYRIEIKGLFLDYVSSLSFNRTL